MTVSLGVLTIPRCQRCLAAPCQCVRLVPAGPHLPPIPPWPADREPDFVAWVWYARNGVRYGKVVDSALVSWVRHRFVRPTPTWVYVLRLGDLTSFYTG